MQRAKFIILFLFITSCAGVPPEPEEIPPTRIEKRIEEVRVEPTINIESAKSIKEKKIKKVIDSKKLPFSVGEKISYDIKYLGIPAGNVEINVTGIAEVDGILAYRFYGKAKTSPIISILYTVDDDLEAYVAVDKLQTIKHTMHVRESRRNQYRTMVFDHKRKKIIFYDRLIKGKKPPRILEYEIDMAHNAVDALAVFYWLRTQEPIVGKDYYRYVFDNGKYWLLKAKVLRKEEIDTPLGKLKTFVVEPYTYLNGVLRQKAEGLIWVTDDEKKIPVKIEAKAKFGTVTAIIKEMPPKKQ